ncbi:MAG: hypothetical protein EA397_06875 [Deltaproteobacteria bacterium]|nr:MAG: hypothetical protein EA397_06875 [Deltaproteobacteria bacterium]
MDGLPEALARALEPIDPLIAWLISPLLGEGTASPLGLAGAGFWFVMIFVSWWWVRRTTRTADADGEPILLRLTVLGLRLLASTLCLILALDLAMIVKGPTLIKGILSLLNTQVFEIGGTSVTVSGIVVLIAVVVATFWGTTVLHNLVTRELKTRGVQTSGTVGVLLNLGRYVVLLIGIAVALTTAGINLTALFTVGAVFAVTIGFALQNIAQNFVSGIILLIEGAIQPGDVLEVENRVVRVIRMGIRSTVVRTIDDEDLILPNSTLAQGLVKNLTMMDTTLRVRATVSVAYGSDLDEVIRVLERAARGVTLRIPELEPIVLLKAFENSGIAFETMLWIEDPWASPMARSQLRLEIWRAFKASNITIPFPQVDVHFDEEVVTLPRPQLAQLPPTAGG